jgi:hypothetical protein
MGCKRMGGDQWPLRGGIAADEKRMDSETNEDYGEYRKWVSKYYIRLEWCDLLLRLERVWIRLTTSITNALVQPICTAFVEILSINGALGYKLRASLTQQSINFKCDKSSTEQSRSESPKTSSNSCHTLSFRLYTREHKLKRVYHQIIQTFYLILWIGSHAEKKPTRCNWNSVMPLKNQVHKF